MSVLSLAPVVSGLFNLDFTSNNLFSVVGLCPGRELCLVRSEHVDSLSTIRRCCSSCVLDYRLELVKLSVILAAFLNWPIHSSNYLLVCGFFPSLCFWTLPIVCWLVFIFDALWQCLPSKFSCKCLSFSFFYPSFPDVLMGEFREIKKKK